MRIKKLIHQPINEKNEILFSKSRTVSKYICTKKCQENVSHSSTKYDFITLDKNLIRLPLYVLEIQVRYPLLQTIKVEVNQSDFVRAF